jgi:hypothetical protein
MLLVAQHARGTTHHESKVSICQSTGARVLRHSRDLQSASESRKITGWAGLHSSRAARFRSSLSSSHLGGVHVRWLGGRRLSEAEAAAKTDWPRLWLSIAQRVGLCRPLVGCRELAGYHKIACSFSCLGSTCGSICAVNTLVRSRVRPNPSLKGSANGRPPGPGRRYAVHFRQPGPGVLPLAPP